MHKHLHLCDSQLTIGIDFFYAKLNFVSMFYVFMVLEDKYTSLAL